MKIAGRAGTVSRTVNAYGACATQLLASTAWTVKFDVPPAADVPESRPAAESVIPGGTVPVNRLNVNGGVPPATVSCCEYATPTVAFGSVGGVIEQPGVGVGVTVSIGVTVAVGVAVTVSAGVTVGVAVTVSAGVTVAVGVAVTVNAGVTVAVGVGVEVGGTGVVVGVDVGVAVGGTGVVVGVGVGVLVGVAVGVGVGVCAATGACDRPNTQTSASICAANPAAIPNGRLLWINTKSGARQERWALRVY